jgi:O-antigen/teichoic acid export membrane protein
MSRTATAMRSVIWMMVESWLVRLVSLVSFFTLARLLVPADFGLIALATIFFVFCTFVIDQGFSVSLIQRPNLETAHLDAVFWTQLAIGVVVSALTFFGSGWLSGVFDEPKLAKVLQALAPLPFLNSLILVQQAQLRRELRFRALAIRRVLSTVSGAVIAICLAISGFGVWSLVAQALASSVVSLLTTWRVSSWRPSFAFSITHLRELAGFGTSVLAHNVVSTLAIQIDRLLLARFAGATSLGLYSVARRFDSIVGETLIVGSQKVVLPVFAAVQHDREAILRGLFRAHRLISLLVFPVFVGMAMTAPELVPILFGEKWAAAVIIVQAAALPSLVSAIGFFLGNVLTAIGRPGIRLALSIVQAVASASFVLIALRWGPAAVAIAMGLAGLVAYIMNIAALHRLIGLPVITYQMQAWPAFAATAVLAVVVFGLQYELSGVLSSVALLSAKVILGGVAYCIAIRLLAPNRWREIMALARIVKDRPLARSEALGEAG